MYSTGYPDINDLLQLLLAQLQDMFGQKLVGLYLYGSLVTGDFDQQSSDIDLLAVTSTDINQQEFEILKRIHDDLVLQYPAWADRIEVAYLSVEALETFKSQTSRIAIISPGEPFHLKDAGKDWLMNWYSVRERGITLFGPSPKELIPLIAKAEFMQAVEVMLRGSHAGGWRDWINQTKMMRARKFQAYAILTLCRALYAHTKGEQVSKKQAALWAAKQFPQWASPINNALVWRAQWRDESVDHETTLPETLTLIDFLIGQIGK